MNVDSSTHAFAPNSPDVARWASLPSRYELVGPTVRTLAALGGAATLGDLAAALFERLALSPEQVTVRSGSDRRSAVRHEFEFGLLYAKAAALVSSPARGRYVLTPEGDRMLAERTDDETFAQLARTARRAPRSDGGTRVGPLVDLPIPDRASDDSTECVYLVQAVVEAADDDRVEVMHLPSKGPIKLGLSTVGEFRARLAALQTGSAFPLVPRRLVRGSLATERALLRATAAYALCGEWRRPVPEVMAIAYGAPLA